RDERARRRRAPPLRRPRYPVPHALPPDAGEALRAAVRPPPRPGGPGSDDAVVGPGRIPLPHDRHERRVRDGPRGEVPGIPLLEPRGPALDRAVDPLRRDRVQPAHPRLLRPASFLRRGRRADRAAALALLDPAAGTLVPLAPVAPWTSA